MAASVPGLTPRAVAMPDWFSGEAGVSTVHLDRFQLETGGRLLKPLTPG